MKQFVYEVLDEVNSKKKKAERIKILKENETWALKDILRGSMDKTIKWNLPEGEPPYTPSEEHNAPTNLQRENTKFRYFARGGPGDQLPGFKRENLFIGLIEGVHPKDAQLVIDMINKKVPKGITREIVKEAFPGLLQD